MMKDSQEQEYFGFLQRFKYVIVFTVYFTMLLYVNNHPIMHETSG